MKIRKVKRGDLKKIGKLMKTEFNKPPYNDGWTDKAVMITVKNYFKIGYGFVAVEEKEIVGFIMVRNEPYSQGVYVIVEELIVKRDFQRKGIGEELIKIVEKKSKKKKAYTIYLYSHKKSHAFKFYKKLGYKESEYMVTMEKKL